MDSPWLKQITIKQIQGINVQKNLVVAFEFTGAARGFTINLLFGPWGQKGWTTLAYIRAHDFCLYHAFYIWFLFPFTWPIVGLRYQKPATRNISYPEWPSNFSACLFTVQWTLNSCVEPTTLASITTVLHTWRPHSYCTLCFNILLYIWLGNNFRG